MLAFSLLSFALNWYKIQYEKVYYPLFVVCYVGILPIALALIVLPTRWLAPINPDGGPPHRRVTKFGKVLGGILFVLGVTTGFVADYYLRNGF